MSELPELPLPDGIRSVYVETALGLTVHYLECGEAHRPVLLLLHGFPELSFSWRKVMQPLAEAGYRVIAPDQRGYGRSSGWARGYDVDLEPYRMPSLVLDQLAFLQALKIEQVHAVVGHDFGSPVAGWCGLIRPDLFQRVVLMSAPFAGPPGITSGPKVDLSKALAALDPPRKHYQWYYSERQAEEDMLSCSQGLKAFLKQYYFLKSSNWQANAPHSLSSWDAEQLAVLPGYYVMPKNLTMAEVVDADSEGEAIETIDGWLSDVELDVYTDEFKRTGLQGGLNWYRASTSPRERQSLMLYSGSVVRVPTLFISGAQDWGMHQSPGALTVMEERTCRSFAGKHVVANAGHWVQQEQPEAVVGILLAFL